MSTIHKLCCATCLRQLAQRDTSQASPRATCENRNADVVTAYENDVLIRPRMSYILIRQLTNELTYENA